MYGALCHHPVLCLILVNAVSLAVNSVLVFKGFVSPTFFEYSQ